MPNLQKHSMAQGLPGIKWSVKYCVSLLLCRSHSSAITLLRLPATVRRMWTTSSGTSVLRPASHGRALWPFCRVASSLGRLQDVRTRHLRGQDQLVTFHRRSLQSGSENLLSAFDIFGREDSPPFPSEG